MKKDLPGPGKPCLRTEKICFGLDRRTDEESLKVFVQKFAASPLLDTLVPRLTDPELSSVLDFLSNLMHTHLHQKEYHRLFLNDSIIP